MSEPQLPARVGNISRWKTKETQWLEDNFTFSLFRLFRFYVTKTWSDGNKNGEIEQNAKCISLQILQGVESFIGIDGPGFSSCKSIFGYMFSLIVLIL